MASSTNSSGTICTSDESSCGDPEIVATTRTASSSSQEQQNNQNHDQDFDIEKEIEDSGPTNIDQIDHKLYLGKTSIRL